MLSFPSLFSFIKECSCSLNHGSQTSRKKKIVSSTLLRLTFISLQAQYNPLQMPRRSNMKERSFFFGSKESLDTIPSARTPRGGNKTNEAAELSESEGQTGAKQEGGKKKLIRRPKKRQKLEVAMGLERDCTSINFRFNSLQVHFVCSVNATCFPLRVTNVNNSIMKL